MRLKKFKMNRKGSLIINMLMFVVCLNVGMNVLNQTDLFLDIRQYDNTGGVYTEASCIAAGYSWQSSDPKGCIHGKTIEKQSDDEMDALIQDIENKTYEDEGILNKVFDTTLGTLGDIITGLQVLTKMTSRAVMYPFDWMSAEGFVNPNSAFNNAWNNVIGALNGVAWLMYTIFFVQLISNRMLER